MRRRGEAASKACVIEQLPLWALCRAHLGVLTHSVGETSDSGPDVPIITVGGLPRRPFCSGYFPSNVQGRGEAQPSREEVWGLAVYAWGW